MTQDTSAPNGRIRQSQQSRDERNNRDDNRPFRDPPISLHIVVFPTLKLLLSLLFFAFITRGPNL